ncbi:type II toxin-antitoxin system HicB family antitoxin [Enterococcus faecium]|uniref:type II toxin-antitoxin system HicB family antitoxin n=1 Tax=Enterococcus faecium TaxID=1352 RepID=UPI00220B79D6|nr:type II toxin-antitoxin system HicB family antitoxin [Enterococcus faecium]BDP92836.1 antitoxin HicB [Enterococcus faecium]BDP96028.1 antitoxin HicB [Enterococcus faecium]BDP99215.1 antitoxin HicB [Enterococcus faecium]
MKTNNIFYPAIFEKEGEAYNIIFPDLPEISTFGNGLEEAYLNAKDALGLALYNVPDAKFPKPSAVEELALKDKQVIVIIELDIKLFRRRLDSKTIRKNVSLPEWLVVLGKEKEVNFSQMLQKALEEELLEK